MKKNILIILLAFLSGTLFAQTEYEALNLSQNDVLGSARYMGMGGAFGALGGDASALKDNPAGLGIFRRGEISFTLNSTRNTTKSNWYNNSEKGKGNLDISVNNFSYVMAIPLWKTKESGLLQSNFSITYNRLKNFNRTLKASGMTNASFTDFVAGLSNGMNKSDFEYREGEYEPYNNTRISWLSILGYNAFLTDPLAGNKWASAFDGKANSTNYMVESGGISEMSLGWAGNFNNRIVIGANFNILDIDYQLNSTLSEKFAKGNFSLNNILEQKGAGINLKIGAIYLPTERLRLGVALHTPTFLSVEEKVDATIDYYNPNFKNQNGSEVKGKEQVPKIGVQEYYLTSPFQAQLSAAYLMGNLGLISAEYNYIDYTAMQFSDKNSSTVAFEAENLGMKEVLQSSHRVKVGLEVKPKKYWALRAGYAFETSPFNPNYEGGKSIKLNTINTNTEYLEQKNTNYFSVGAGYRKASWYFDMAYMTKLTNADFYPYQFNRADLKPADITSFTGNFVMTLGFRL